MGEVGVFNLTCVVPTVLLSPGRHRQNDHTQPDRQAPWNLQRGGRTAQEAQPPAVMSGLDEDVARVRSDLLKIITESKITISALFSAWDTDGSGTISRTEFHHAILALGVDCTTALANKVYSTCDTDGSGALDYHELHAALERQDAQPNTKLQPGAADGENAHALRTGPAGPKHVVSTEGVTLDANGDVVEQLRTLLADNFVRVRDIFAGWDASGDGHIDASEFYMALGQLGLEMPSREVSDELFASWDTDGSGEIDLRELHTLLRQGSSITLADERLVAGAVEYEMESKNKHELRTGGAQTTHSRLLGANVVDVSGAPASHDANHASSSPDGLMTADSLAEQLAIALSARGAKVVQLFQEWDASGDGHVDKAEFARALSLLGLPAERALSDALFDAFDVDGSGKIEYRELHSMLRKHAAAVAAARDVRMAERDAKRAAEEAKIEAAQHQQQTSGLSRAFGEGGEGNGFKLPLTRRPRARGKPIVPIRERLLEILPKLSPRISQALQQYAGGDGCVDARYFAKGVLEAGRRPFSRTGEAPFLVLGADGRDTRGMTEVLGGLFAELHQAAGSDADAEGRVPIAAIPARIRRLRERRQRSVPVFTTHLQHNETAAAATAPQPPLPPAGKRPSPRASKAKLVGHDATGEVANAAAAPPRKPRPPKAPKESASNAAAAGAKTVHTHQEAARMAAQIVESHAKLDEHLSDAKVQVRRAAKKRKKRQAEGAHWLPHIPMNNEARLREYVQRGEELRAMMRHVMEDPRAQPAAFGAETGTTGAPAGERGSGGAGGGGWAPIVFGGVPPKASRPYVHEDEESGTILVAHPPRSHLEGTRTRVLHQGPRRARASRKLKDQLKAELKAEVMAELKAEMLVGDPPPSGAMPAPEVEIDHLGQLGLRHRLVDTPRLANLSYDYHEQQYDDQGLI